MGWRRYESIIEKRREQIGVDPLATVRAVREDLADESLKPRDRVRLLGILVACYRHIGNRRLVEETVAEARAIPKAGKIARLEIDLQEMTAFMEWALQGKEAWETALSLAVYCIHETQKLVPAKGAKTAWGRRQERNRSTLRVVALIARGQVALYTGDFDTALEYGFRGLRELPAYPRSGCIPRALVRPIRSAIELVANALIRGGKGTTVEYGIWSVEKLIESLPSAENVVRSCLSGLLACTEVKKGRFDEAARMFETAAETLASVGASSSYSFVMTLWKKSVKDVAVEAKRLEGYLARRRIKLPEC